MAIDMDKLQEFLDRFVADLGATFAAGNVVIGHRLGLYRALAAGPARAEELAERTGTSPRYIAEWLRGQAAGGYLEYDPATEAYSMTEEQAFALADPDGGVYIPGAFVLALGTLKAEPRITEAFRTGAGMGWHEHNEDVFAGCEQFFRPGYTANLIPSWIPALDGVAGKLLAGAAVADIGCGLGASTILPARQYPNSRFTGSDYHDQSIQIARKRACTTWATRSPRPGTSGRRPSPTAPGWWSSRTRPTKWPATSIPSGGSTTTPPPSCACPTPCPSPAATPSAPRPASRHLAGGRRSRVHQVPPSGRNPVQPGLRGAPVSSYYSHHPQELPSTVTAI
jgi:transcriptional regulator with XRE-family HTH domain